MTRYVLGADIGSTKTHALVADETGRTVGFGKGGLGNHTAVFLEHTGSQSIEEMLENLTTGKIEVHADAAPLVFQVAAGGDPVAMELVRWAGCELGELACAVIRQLGFEELAFDVVLVGSMFEAAARLIEPMRETIHTLAPGARLVRLTVPPVIGAVLLGMEQAGLPALERREALIHSARQILPG